MNRKVKLRIRDLHAHVTCYLCDGYFIDATTIIECLHSFCRTCIVRYLADHKSCPVCRGQVHKTRPLLNIRHDQTLQDIVYMLVPGLRHDEMRRRRQFWKDNMDKNWQHRTPEELGETDQSLSKSSQKICLSIEPNKMFKGKLSTKSDWVEIDKSIQKRFIRCSHDVTVHHLQKFMRMKLKEDDAVEVLMFFNGNILPDNFTLSEVIDAFPCPLNQILEISFGIFAPKSLKRKAVDKIAEPTVGTSQKKRRLPSATPQLKAFFNSQMSPKSVKLPTTKSLKSMHESAIKTELFNNEDDSEEARKMQLLKMVQLKTVANTTNQNVKHEPDNQIPKKEASTKDVLPVKVSVNQKPPLESQTNQKQDSHESKVEEPPKENEKSVKDAEQNSKQVQKNGVKRNFVQICPKPALEPVTSRSQKTSENVQCFAMLNIPVDEAVRSKPPTPVEVPIFATKVKRPSDSNHPFVRHLDAKQQRSRRKPINPTYHAQELKAGFESPPKPTSDHHQLSSPASPGHDKGKYETVRIPPASRTGQFILLTTQATTPTVGFVPHQEPHKASKAGPQKHYERLSNAQAHRVALDAVRSTMGKVLLQPDKRPLAPNRPILPKTSGISLVVQNAIPARHTQTRNIFQNEQSTYPMTSSAKQQPTNPVPQRSVKAVASKRQSDIANLQVQAHHKQRNLLNQMAAAVANSDRSDRKSVSADVTSPRNCPPPPYHSAINTQSSSSIKRDPAANMNSPRGNVELARSNQHLPRSSAISLMTPHTSLATQHPLRSPGANRPPPTSTVNTFSIRSQPGKQIMSRNPAIGATRSPTGNPSAQPLISNQHGVQSLSRNFLTTRVLPRSSATNPISSSGPTSQQLMARSSGSNRNVVRPTNHTGLSNHNSTSNQSISRLLSTNQQPARNISTNHNSPRGMTNNLARNTAHSSSTRPTANQNVARQHSTNQIPSAVKNLLASKPNKLHSQLRAEKRKPNILRKPPINTPSFTIATPPAGTRSPWSSRTYPFPVTSRGSEYTPPVKLSHSNRPPPAHQHHPVSQQPSTSLKPPTVGEAVTSSTPDMPLELTSRTRKLSHSPNPPTNSAERSRETDQPLCLVVKKT